MMETSTVEFVQKHKWALIITKNEVIDKATTHFRLLQQQSSKTNNNNKCNTKAEPTAFTDFISLDIILNEYKRTKTLDYLFI